MTWSVIVAKPARKQLARFPAEDQRKIEATLRAMTLNYILGPFRISRSGLREASRPNCRRATEFQTRSLLGIDLDDLSTVIFRRDDFAFSARAARILVLNQPFASIRIRLDIPTEFS